jgi:hypothetical protein
MKTLLAMTVLLLGLAACSDNGSSTSPELQATGQNPVAQNHETTLELTMAEVRLTMTVFSCTGAGSQFQQFELAADVDPGDSGRNYVGLSAFEMADVADRPLSSNVLVTINLSNDSGTQRDLWTSETIDSFQHEGNTVQVSGSATGLRHRWNADGTQVLEAPSKVDGGAPRTFRISAECP